MRGSAAFRTGVAPGGALAGPWAPDELWRKALAVPSLDLDFAKSKSLVDNVSKQNLVTFTRASSATYVGSDGQIKTASTDVPRFDHNPTTGESLGLLVEEARTNLVLRSEEFDNAVWTKFRGSITANASTSPNGTLSAEKFVEDATASNTHGLFATITIVTATAYTYSVYIKAAGRPWVVLGLDVGTGEKKTWFNLSTGAIGTNANTTATISPAGNDWYRCIVTSTSAATSATCALKLATNDNVESYNGDGTSGIYVWGAQLEAGAFPTSYIPTTTATVTRAADVASITGANFGVTRTNLLLRSEEFDATWTPTALQAFGSGSIANAIASPSGSITADLITENTANSEHNVLQAITVTVNTVYTLSCFAKKGTRSILAMSPTSPGVANYYTLFNLDTGAIVFNETGNTSTITALGNGWYRCSITRTTGAAQVSINNKIGIANNALSTTYTGDGTSGIYVWGAQLETGSTATPYIPTTTAAVSVFESSWYSQTEGTVFADVVSAPNNTIAQLAADISDTPGNERIFVRRTGAGSLAVAVIDGGVTQADVGAGPVISGGARYATAASYRLNSINLATNGQIGTEDTTATIPTPDRMFIGQNFASTQQAGGTIRRLVCWGQRLPNNVLQAITQ